MISCVLTFKSYIPVMPTTLTCVAWRDCKT